MQVYVNYPTTDECKKIFLNNLATFKAELFLQCINNLNIEDKLKDEVLEKALEILNDKSTNSVI